MLTNVEWFCIHDVTITVKIVEMGSRRTIARDWGEGKGSLCLVRTESQLRKVKSSGDGRGWGWWLHNGVHILNDTELHT